MDSSDLKKKFEYLLKNKEVKKFNETVRKNYYVSNTGEVFSESKSNQSITQLKLNKNENGYLLVTIDKKHYKIHRLVCEMFLDDYDKNLQVNHINFNKEDNRIENLEMCTCNENLLHRYHSKKLNSFSLSVNDIRSSEPFSKNKYNQTQILGFHEIMKEFLGNDAFYCEINDLSNISKK